MIDSKTEWLSGDKPSLRQKVREGGEKDATGKSAAQRRIAGRWRKNGRILARGVSCPSS